MKNKLRKKLNLLAKHISDNFKYEKITSKVDNVNLYLCILIHEGDDYLLTKEDVVNNFEYIDAMIKFNSTGIYPGDIRNIKGEDNNYDF